MIRLLFTLLLALTLATTSVPAAVMRAKMLGATEMVICSDTPTASGLATLTLDATGKPFTPHNCPECLAALGMAVLPTTPMPPAPPSGATLIAFAAAQHSASRPLPFASARGPPLFV